MSDKDVTKLTPAQKKRFEKYSALRQELIEKGFEEKKFIISALKANLMVFVTSVPIVVVFWIIYAVLHGSGRLNRPLIFALVLVSIIIHELIHGITWSLFTEKGWDSISFGVIWKYLTPYCTCDEYLPYGAYFLGGIAPTIILGFIPYIIALFTGNYTLLFISLFNILVGGGDIYIVYLIRKCKDAIFIDHPYLVGCVAFKKESEGLGEKGGGVRG
ncbi:MAG TPA: DUF3267 domain-containing protein [Halanaerobiales bacterium]|nr:DUF3267 domain-containing protein [Halanaerobiales bacterium]